MFVIFLPFIKTSKFKSNFIQAEVNYIEKLTTYVRKLHSTNFTFMPCQSLQFESVLCIIICHDKVLVCPISKLNWTQDHVCRRTFNQVDNAVEWPVPFCSILFSSVSSQFSFTAESTGGNRPGSRTRNLANTDLVLYQ